MALGTVIRGGTAHFEYVAGEASSGLGQVAMQAEIPVAFGVLTTENIEQAIERAGTKAGNKGAEAALTALEMVNLYNKLMRHNSNDREKKEPVKKYRHVVERENVRFKHYILGHSLVMHQNKWNSLSLWIKI